jgi:Protein of unknown function (DUF1326)
MRGVEFAPIEFEVADDLCWWSARIPGKVQARGEALAGPTTLPGQRVQVHNPPGAEIGPGGVATQGVAVTETPHSPRSLRCTSRSVGDQRPDALREVTDVKAPVASTQEGLRVQSQDGGTVGSDSASWPVPCAAGRALSAGPVAACVRSALALALK